MSGARRCLVHRTTAPGAHMAGAASTVRWMSLVLTLPKIREWFSASGFDEVAFDAPDTDSLTSVGVHRLATAPEASPPGEPLFTFTFAEA